jgi:squalene-hopene/tetraprenyl-beta-curcumene cyclase
MRAWALTLALVGLIGALASPSVAAENDAAAVSAKGVKYLQGAQNDDGSYSPDAGPGITAIVAAALIRSGESPDDAVVAKALKFVEQHLHDDGGVYAEGSTHKNYETCIAMMAFHAANKDGRYDEALKRAEAFIKKDQWDEGEKLTKVDLAYGGSGYGSHSRPDLSNTSFLIDALKMVGNSPEDPAIQRALIFVSRCQNLETEHNETEFAGKVGDGGFYYTIAAGGSSQAGPTDDGGLRSYGSMTYAGLKSMIYAGVGKDDKRVAAALEWIRKNYKLDENPGMGAQGLYYYYHTFAKALAAVGEDKLKDEAGVEHDWRQELVQTLAAAQQSNGSWVNENERWLEGDPNLVTAYALLALSYTK